jgi:hypothetical protein
MPACQANSLRLEPPIQAQQTPSTFHPLAQRSAFRRRDVRLQQKSFGPRRVQDTNCQLRLRIGFAGQKSNLKRIYILDSDRALSTGVFPSTNGKQADSIRSDDLAFLPQDSRPQEKQGTSPKNESLRALVCPELS